MDNILITGAASGIGAATARLFHANGWKVGLLDVNQTALQDLAAELGGAWHRVLDVTDAAASATALLLCAVWLAVWWTLQSEYKAHSQLALNQADNNRTRAARLLGASRRTLYNKLAEHGLS